MVVLGLINFVAYVDTIKRISRCSKICRNPFNCYFLLLVRNRFLLLEGSAMIVIVLILIRQRNFSARDRYCVDSN